MTKFGPKLLQPKKDENVVRSYVATIMAKHLEQVGALMVFANKSTFPVDVISISIRVQALLNVVNLAEPLLKHHYLWPLAGL